MRSVMLASAALAGAACSSASPIHMDAGLAEDAAVTVVDGGIARDASVTDMDAAWHEGDAAFVPDADRCGACVPSSVCNVARCVEGACIEEPVPDGLDCSDGSPHVCVDGACIPRFGCGDGYREPGPAPAREPCDDGNDRDDDACTTACSPAPVVVASRPGGDDATLGAVPAVAADGRGRLAFVWTDRAAGRVLATLLSRDGERLRALDAPIVVADGIDPDLAAPTVTGLANGWVVVWSALTRESLGDVRHRQLSPDGTLGPELAAHPSSADVEHEARVATLAEGGWAIAWTAELARPEVRIATVRVRSFDRSGAPRGPPLDVDASSRTAIAPSLASGASGLAIAWASIDGDTAPSVRVRRLDAAGMMADPAPVEIAEGFEPTLAGLTSGGYALAWTTRDLDGWGDLRGTIVPAAGAPATTTFTLANEASRPERLAAVAALGDGGIVAYAVGTSVVGRVVDGRLAPWLLDAPSGASSVAALLGAAGVQSDLSVARGHDGVWIVWTEDTDPLAHGAHRSVVAHYLAPE